MNSLTTDQRWSISADLSIIKAMGFSHVRTLIFTKVNDPTYSNTVKWPAANFLTWPIPTPREIANLGEFFAMTEAFGLTCEVIPILADSTNHYYLNGVTADDYRRFIDAIWPAMWQGALNRIYLGGDLRLGDADDPTITASHRQFVHDIWPYLVSLCPACSMGLEIQCQNASFWDRGVDTIAWIRANVGRPPDYLGGQLYPTSHAALIALGFEKNGVVDWRAVTQTWIANMRAAAGSIQVFADEIGCAVGTEFTEMDQSDFLCAAYGVFNAAGMPTNVWEFGDHPKITDLGMFTVDRRPRLATTMLRPYLAAARAAWLAPGIQYIPPEFDDMGWVTPR